MALEDADGAWSEGARGGPAVVSGVRGLPLELREALLLVALGGFSHQEAAVALDIPLTCLLERLERARTRLAQHMGVALEAPRQGWRGPSHLRVIK